MTNESGPPKWEEMKLADLAGGRLEERFQEALQAVAENVDDPDTKRKVGRKVKLTLTLTPLDEERRECRAELDVETTLAGKKGFGLPAYVVRGAGGRFSVQTTDMRQKKLELDTPVGGGADGDKPQDGKEN